MEKGRQVKILSILALIIAVLGMTLGFAAFSTTLSIASSADVTPSSEDFKLKIYGFRTYDDFSAFRSEYESGILHEEVLSEDVSIGFTGSNAIAELATIDNTDLSISNMKISFEYPNSEKSYYYFYIKNVGKYRVYFDKETYKSVDATKHFSCGVDGNVSNSVLEPCEYLVFGFSSTEMDLSTIKRYADPGDGFMLTAYWGYNGPYFDIPFYVQWQKIPLPYTSVPQNYE